MGRELSIDDHSVQETVIRTGSKVEEEGSGQYRLENTLL